MEKHVNLLGIMFIVYGAIGLLGAAVVLVLFLGTGALSTGASGEIAPGIVLSTIGLIIAGIVLFSHLPAFIAGLGLVKFKSWARILTIIVAVLSLPSPPFGTALGIYALWVMLQDETSRLLEHSQPQTA